VPKKKKTKNKMNTVIFIIVCLIILGGFFGLISLQAGTYNGLRQDHNRLLADIAREEAIYEALRYQMAHFDSDAYIEELARNRLGWVRPNEMVLRPRSD